MCVLDGGNLICSAVLIMHPVANYIDDRNVKLLREQKASVQWTFEPLARRQDGLGPCSILIKVEPSVSRHIASAVSTWLVARQIWELQHVPLVIAIAN